MFWNSHKLVQNSLELFKTFAKFVQDSSRFLQHCLRLFNTLLDSLESVPELNATYSETFLVLTKTLKIVSDLCKTPLVLFKTHPERRVEDTLSIFMTYPKFVKDSSTWSGFFSSAPPPRTLPEMFLTIFESYFNSLQTIPGLIEKFWNLFNELVKILLNSLRRL